MAWRWFSKRTAKQPESSEALLAHIDRQEQRFFAALAEKDAQIRMVLEERFFRPVLAPPEQRAKSVVAVRPEEVSDVTVYPRESDGRQVEADNQRLRQAELNLDEALADEVRQVAAERNGESPTREPAETLDRIAPQADQVRNHEERMEAARRAIMEVQL